MVLEPASFHIIIQLRTRMIKPKQCGPTHAPRLYMLASRKQHSVGERNMSLSQPARLSVAKSEYGSYVAEALLTSDHHARLPKTVRVTHPQQTFYFPKALCLMG
jgi:hypothetical protein